jgi:hypothetical protein
MGAKCSCGFSSEKDTEFAFQNPIKNVDDILPNIKPKFKESYKKIDKINEEEFEKEFSSFPNAKNLIEEYESKIIEQSDKNIQTTYQPTSDNKIFETFELSDPIKFEEDDNNYYLYKGSMNKNYDFSGKGYQITNNYLYYGYFKNNEFNGKGLLINKDGSILFGDWVNGACTGKGVLKINNKLEYEGDFFENKKHGRGVETYPDGSKYEGEFKDNQKNGKGKCIISNGEIYEGEFKDDLFNGKGTYKWMLENREYTGDFKNGNMDGYGINKFKDGSIYEGHYKNGLKHGKGKYFWPNGKVFYGNWLNNKLHGTGYYEMNNEKYYITFRFGKIISTSKDEEIDRSKCVKFGKENIYNKNLSDVEKYICHICNKILYQPLKCSKCFYNYCTNCIKDGNNYQKCKKCDGNEFEFNLDLYFDLISLNLFCNECQKVLDYHSSLSHCHS